MQEAIGACRDEIKGAAILWVVFFHAQLGLGGLLYDVQKIGYGGVDMFLFLSGFGLYHSLSRDADAGRYLLRRARRLLPAYLPFCLVWLCMMLPLYDLGMVQSVRVAAGNLLMLGFFAGTPAMINWYVSALALTLMLAPLVYGLMARASHPRRCAVLVAAACFAGGLCFIGTEAYMAVSRLPVFVLGMAAAVPARKGGAGGRCARTGGAYALALAGGACGLAALYGCFARFPETLDFYGMYWHPFVLIAPALCAGLGWLFSRAGRGLAAFAPLRALGRASFEIFLFNAWVEVLGKRFGLAQGPVSWLLWSLGSVLAGLAYHAVVERCVKRAARGARRSE